MKERAVQITDANGGGVALPVTEVHTLVLGSGAAGLNAALQLSNMGVDDVLIVTEGLGQGTSINTGSDKQTYYKLSLCGDVPDSPRDMAQVYFGGGSMHGDLALVEAGHSARAFLHLVDLGVPFPQDPFGQFVGYKTDHDPGQRATSIGPYTSREMCRALIREVQGRGIPVLENCSAVSLLTDGAGDDLRAAGILALDSDGKLRCFLCENLVFAVGGPGGLYRTSVYPAGHTGAIGLALLAGARAQNLPESQYGLASTKFRWNVSGTYMQVIPRFVSTAPDGVGEPEEFMRPYFAATGEMCSMVFLKGYQWPFDPRKVSAGSSLIDILVYIETVTRGRRVFLDFSANPAGFRFEDLSGEAREYLSKSRALQGVPIERLRAMNPGAVELYLDNGIDIAAEPLEIAVCAQHNNGGLAANPWWESLNVRHLFPVGEVNGSHGVYRPGGSALNAGQVAGFRAAAFIANRYSGWTLDTAAAEQTAVETAQDILAGFARGRAARPAWQDERAELQARMSRAAAQIRSVGNLKAALVEAQAQWDRIEAQGCAAETPADRIEGLRNRQLCFAQRCYLQAVLTAAESGAGSRGSAMVLAAGGQRAHHALGPEWCFAAEDESFREKVLETVCADGAIRSSWIARRPIPESDEWFETAWAAFREGRIYGAG